MERVAQTVSPLEVWSWTTGPPTGRGTAEGLDVRLIRNVRRRARGCFDAAQWRKARFESSFVVTRLGARADLCGEGLGWVQDPQVAGVFGKITQSNSPNEHRSLARGHPSNWCRTSAATGRTARNGRRYRARLGCPGCWRLQGQPPAYRGQRPRPSFALSELRCCVRSRSRGDDHRIQLAAAGPGSVLAVVRGY